jgi:hypothetical protein
MRTKRLANQPTSHTDAKVIVAGRIDEVSAAADCLKPLARLLLNRARKVLAERAATAEAGSESMNGRELPRPRRPRRRA